MKVLLVLGIVALALVLLSFLRLGALVEYGASGVLVRVKVGPFRLQVFPRKPKKEKAAGPAKRRKKAPPAGEEPAQKRGGPLSMLRHFLPIITEAAGRMKKKIRVDTLYLDFVAAADDPAVAALAFGGANAAVGMIWPLIEQNFNVKDRRIRTAVDFQAKRPTVWLNAAATLTLGQALRLGVGLTVRFLRLFSQFKAQTQAQQAQKPSTEKQKEAV